mmetsp:Transcript_33056/g.74329  ORF Transcript_33056/g.74329 Transcript_33056/m.74329 type:complete len:225 (+) Transcript_33056:246-920(+)
MRLNMGKGLMVLTLMLNMPRIRPCMLLPRMCEGHKAKAWELRCRGPSLKRTATAPPVRRRAYSQSLTYMGSKNLSSTTSPGRRTPSSEGVKTQGRSAAGFSLNQAGFASKTSGTPFSGTSSEVLAAPVSVQGSFLASAFSVRLRDRCSISSTESPESKSRLWARRRVVALLAAARCAAANSSWAPCNTSPKFRAEHPQHAKTRKPLVRRSRVILLASITGVLKL